MTFKAWFCYVLGWNYLFYVQVYIIHLAWNVTQVIHVYEHITLKRCHWTSFEFYLFLFTFKKLTIKILISYFVFSITISTVDFSTNFYCCISPFQMYSPVLDESNSYLLNQHGVSFSMEDFKQKWIGSFHVYSMRKWIWYGQPIHEFGVVFPAL